MSDAAAPLTSTPDTGADTGGGADNDAYIDNIIAAGSENSLEGDDSDSTEAGGKQTGSPAASAQQPAAEAPATGEQTESLEDQLTALAAEFGLDPANPRD